MKKLLGIVFVFALLGVFAPKADALQCGNNFREVVDPITFATTTLNTFLGCGGSDPGLVTMQWGLTGNQTPRVGLGATVTDERGYTDVC